MSEQKFQGTGKLYHGLHLVSDEVWSFELEPPELDDRGRVRRRHAHLSFPYEVDKVGLSGRCTVVTPRGELYELDIDSVLVEGTHCVARGKLVA